MRGTPSPSVERVAVAVRAAFAAFVVCFALVAPAVPAAPAVASEHEAAHRTPASQAGYLAERLREDPVYVSDQVPRTAPRSSVPEFARQARRTGVPTYVILLPGESLGRSGERLLEQVHDRLGRDGLYVFVDDTGIGGAALAFGVDVPAAQAMRAAFYELPADAGPLTSFTRFVDVLGAGEKEAARRAEAAAEEYEDEGEPEGLHISEADRENQSVLTGGLLLGVPLSVLLLGRYVHRRRARRRAETGEEPGATAKGATGTEGRVGARGRVGPLSVPLVAVPLAALSALAIGLGAPLVFDQTRSSGDPLPGARDLGARVGRVAEALRDDPVYADPESAHGLTLRQLDALGERIDGLGVPVRVAVVPSTPEDESGGDSALLAGKLHEALDEEGVYVVAGPSGDAYEVVNYGAGLDDEELYAYTESIDQGDGANAKKPGLYDGLDALLTHIDETRSGPPGEPRVDPVPAEDPVAQEALPALYSGAFWGGLALGPVGALAALGLTAAAFAAAGHIRRRRSGGARPGPGEAMSAPALPGTGWLRRTARRERDWLEAGFARAGGELPEAARTRVRSCLDTAALLLGREGGEQHGPDQDPPTLATALALLRAGRAVLDAGHGQTVSATLCALNPLHGPATASGRFAHPDDTSPRNRPVCSSCHEALADPVKSLTAPVDRLLRLREERSGPFVPFDRLSGSLGAASSAGAVSVDRLVDQVRESLAVH
ncbi:hypothetical protein ACWGJ2_27460 [Streptomyces sp. NPDC054796]